MATYSLACPTVGCYQNFLCDPEFQNKIVAVALIKKSAAADIDKTTPELWMNSLFNAYLEGNGYLIFNTSGEKPKPDTATTSGRGMQNLKALAKTHNVTVQDMQGVTQSNVQFYNDMLANGQNYDFYYFTPSRIWDASGNYVTIIGDPIITADLNTYQMAEVSFQWVSKVNPLPYEFDTNNFLEGLYFNIVDATTQLTPTSTFEFTTATTINTNWSANINQTGMLSIGDIIWKLQNGTDVIPSGLTIDSETGDLIESGASDNDTYNLVVVATNAAGCVFGTLDIVVTINIAG